MGLPDLKIPESYLPGIKHLIALTEDQIGELISALQTEKPTFYLSKELAKDVASKVSIDATVVSAVIDSITGMYNARAATGRTVEEFAQVLISAVESEDLKPPDEESWIRFRNTIDRLLKLNGALAVASKAGNVVTQQDHTFCDARVLTDMRPVFRDNPEAPPSAMAIIHTLRINFHQRRDLQSFFVALDSRDVVKLRELLERAQKKEKTLKKVAKNANIPLINIAGESEP